VKEFERAEWKRTRSQGPTLSYLVRRAPSPKAGLAIVHGFADHVERFRPVMDIWAEHGLTSAAIDLRGHGQSGGQRGHILAFDEYVDDFRELLAILEAKAPALPRVLFAHSFGAVVSLKGILAGAGPIRAVALSDPYFATAFVVPAVKRVAGRIFSKLWPSLGLPSGLKGEQMSTDAKTAREYDADPLLFKLARARWFTETLAAQAELLARAREFTLPLYVTFGTADEVASAATARAFFDACGSTEKKWEALEGLRHEPLHEPEHGASIAARIGDWLAARA
jgi:alpha-beta hydrolase superfamily lysophospholipase